MSISREFGPRYDTPEKQIAELARRQHISDGLNSLTPEEIEQRRQRMSVWQKGASKPEQTIRGWSHTWNAIYPLILRDALVREMMELTDFSYSKLRAAIYNKKRKVDRVDDYTSPEKERERRSRSHKGRRLGIPLNPSNPEDQKRNIAFARALLDAGLITSDTSYHEKLRELYFELGRQLPEELSERIRLEAFLRANKNMQEGDSSLMDKYQELGDKIDAGWFRSSLVSEEKFLLKAECRHHWVLGDPKEGIVHGDCKKCGDRKIYSEKSELNNAGRAFQLAREKGRFQRARQLT